MFDLYQYLVSSEIRQHQSHIFRGLWYETLCKWSSVYSIKGTWNFQDIHSDCTSILLSFDMLHHNTAIYQKKKKKGYLHKYMKNWTNGLQVLFFTWNLPNLIPVTMAYVPAPVNKIFTKICVFNINCWGGKKKFFPLTVGNRPNFFILTETILTSRCQIHILPRWK